MSSNYGLATSAHRIHQVCCDSRCDTIPGRKNQFLARLFEWSRHDGSECRVSVILIYLILLMRHSYVVIYCVCHHFPGLRVGGASKGGRPKVGRPKRSTPAEMVSRVTATAPDPFFHSLTEPPKPTNNDNLYLVCFNILERPIELECGSGICLVCRTNWIQISDCIQCPCCYNSLEGHTNSPSQLTLGVIGQQLVECSNGCNRTVKVELYHQHIQSHCQSHYEHSMHSPS